MAAHFDSLDCSQQSQGGSDEDDPSIYRDDGNFCVVGWSDDKKLPFKYKPSVVPRTEIMGKVIRLSGAKADDLVLCEFEDNDRHELAFTYSVLDADIAVTASQAEVMECRKRRRLTRKISVPPLDENPLEIKSMLDDLLTGAPGRALAANDDTGLDIGDIRSDLAALEVKITKAIPLMPKHPTIMRLCQCALASLEFRLVDFGLLGKIMLLQATEGGLFVTLTQTVCVRLSLEGGLLGQGDSEEGQVPNSPP